MTLDVDKLYAKFRDISESVGRLRAFAEVPLEVFLADQDKRDVASFRLIVATEAAIDLCLHIAAKRLGKVAEEYAACFQLLADDRVIERDLADRLGKMARFRNLLVHQYWQIDYSRLYEIITGPTLQDLEAFVREVGRLMEDKT
jgi:uncharacterized protein YutE (UPF0331/DUF86 family)